jgi:DnaJ-domain-containing protein 1
MNRNDIVRQYKWMKILRVLVKIFTALFLVMIIGVCIYIGGKLYLSTEFFSMAERFSSLFVAVFILGNWKSFMSYLQKLLTNYFEKKWGMTEKEIKDYISRRALLGDKPNLYVLPYVSRLCSLNEDGRWEQRTVLSGWFSEDEMILAFETDYTDSQIETLNEWWKQKDLFDTKNLMDLLFKLAIVQDGIRNDEWNLLMSIMMQWGFNKNYIEFYKDRYSPLRTEFDESEYRSNVSRQDHTVSYLKPYFELLGLDENATDEEIKRAYHNLALQHHPDLPKNSARIEECETLMAKLNEAYEKVRR